MILHTRLLWSIKLHKKILKTIKLQMIHFNIYFDQICVKKLSFLYKNNDVIDAHLLWW